MRAHPVRIQGYPPARAQLHLVNVSTGLRGCGFWPGDIVRLQTFEGDEGVSYPVGLCVSAAPGHVTVIWSGEPFFGC